MTLSQFLMYATYEFLTYEGRVGVNNFKICCKFVISISKLDKFIHPLKCHGTDLIYMMSSAHL